MLKFEHWEGVTGLQTKGSLVEVMADIGLLIALVHGELKRTNAAAAGEFRRAMQAGFSDDSPVWEGLQRKAEVQIGKGCLDLMEMLKRRKEAEAGESGT